MTDAARLISAAFNLASQASKEVIRNNLKFPLNQLCNYWSHSVGDTMLFGADAIKKAKELEDQTRTIAGMGQNRRYGRFREGYGGSYRYDHGGRHGKQFWGRRHYHGYQRPSAHQPSKFKAKTVTKQSFKRKRDSGEKSEVCVQNSNATNDQQKSQVTKLCNTEPLSHIDLKHTPENFVGGKLANHLAECQSLTSDIHILNAIRGYSIPFTEIPSQEHAPRPIHMKPDAIDGLNF